MNVSDVKISGLDKLLRSSAEQRFYAVLAVSGFEEQLMQELASSSRAKIIAQLGDLFICDHAPKVEPLWARNHWRDARVLSFASIADAAKQLKALQRHWASYSFQLHRRSELIAQSVSKKYMKSRDFEKDRNPSPLGSFSLLDASTLIASAHCSSPFANGLPHFKEFHEGPPSRAYLKIFEALTLAGKTPSAEDTCLELGASPGGWTWALINLGAKVIAYDRSDLAPYLMASSLVDFRRGDAFAATPECVGKISWLFSDVICYPRRLLEYVKLWMDSGLCENYVCTLKFQGAEHYDVIPEFRSLPGKLVHLAANKHELTWINVSG